VFLSGRYAAATGTSAGEGEYCGEGAGGECAEGLFCNFDSGSGGLCVACSGCPSCDDCGLPVEGAASCTSMCVGTAAANTGFTSYGEFDQSGSGSGDHDQIGAGSGSALGSSPGPPGSNAGALRCYAGDGTDIIQVIPNFDSASNLLA
jgi:hypothetical protein